MKKILFGASALALMAGAASAAEPLKLGLGGYFNVYGVYVNQDDGVGMPGVNTRNFDVKREGQINFMGSTKLDNGLTVGVQTELKNFMADDVSPGVGSTDQIDASYLFLSGGFGKVILGSEYGAAYLMQVTAPAVDENFDGFNPKFMLPNVTGSQFNTYAQNNTGKFEKVTYLSPVFSGFQAGISLLPQPCKIGSANTTACTNPFFGMSTDNTGLQAGYDLAVKYSGVAGGTTFDVGAGYTKIDNKAAAPARDPKAWNIGANVGFGAFKVGAAYIKMNTVTANIDAKAYDLGLTYDMGAYTVGASYYHSSQDMGVGIKDDTNARFVVGGTYTYGPGMTFKGSIQHFDLDSATATDKNDAWAIVLGTNVNF